MVRHDAVRRLCGGSSKLGTALLTIGPPSDCGGSAKPRQPDRAAHGADIGGAPRSVGWLIRIRE